MLIWHAEASGVWRAPGGLHAVADAVARRFGDLGGVVKGGHGVAEVVRDGDGFALMLEDGSRDKTQAVVFNGDPRALSMGALGAGVQDLSLGAPELPRSLSARVWSFAGELADAPPLAHHNVFFANDPREEFDSIENGQMPRDPTVYVCAQDRGLGLDVPNGPERFEIIMNAAPLTQGRPPQDEENTCRRILIETLARFGMRVKAPPEGLVTPAGFEAMFPASAGALYGMSPHAMTSALKRPRARTKIPGLYLAGGGVHPGPGVPMAALSGRFAAEAICADLASI